MAIEALSGWTKEQRHVVAASFLGWTLDAFDFFLMVFVFSDIEKEFQAPDWFVAFTITLTLGVRPIGALIFGRAADHFGRRPTLMVDVILYAVLDFASGFAPNLTTLFRSSILLLQCILPSPAAPSRPLQGRWRLGGG